MLSPSPLVFTSSSALLCGSPVPFFQSIPEDGVRLMKGCQAVLLFWCWAASCVSPAPHFDGAVLSFWGFRKRRDCKHAPPLQQSARHQCP
jgi:hypothetical protein